MNSVLPKRIVLEVDLDYFYAQCEEVRNPALKGKPVVVCVYSGRSENSGAVSTANYVARKLGVRSGMPIINAMKMLKDVKDATFLPMDRDYYETVSERIMGLLHSFSNQFEQVSIDEAFLDLSEGTGRDFDRAEAFGRALKNAILDTESLTSSVGIAENKILAKLAVDSKKPDGLAVLRPDQVESFLRDKPVGKLFGIGPKSEAKLEELGIKTIGQLAVYDETKLTQKFGKHLGPQLKRLASGIDEDPVRERPIEQLGRIITLKTNATSLNFSDELIPLVKDITKRMADLNMEAKTIGIIAITSQLKTKNRARTLDRATSSVEEISRVAQELFEEFFKDSKDEIRRAGIRVSGLVERKKESARVQSSLTDFTG
jgi:DNA polymerase IV (archaeal DinB-like DNA polymerase)